MGWWPFTPPKSSKDRSSVIEDAIANLSPEPAESGKTKESILNTEWRHFTDPRNLVPVVILTTACIGSYSLYRSFLRRIPQAKDIPQHYWRRRSLKGVVTRVGDGDNFHLYHTPGGLIAGWGWLRRVPKDPKQLKDQTIHVRKAGIDAPEVAHFGRPGQPGGPEALKWSTDYLTRRRVKVKPYKRDQYDRAVATVFVWKFLLRRDVSLEMLKRGLATIYEAKTGMEFGGREQMYRKAEEKAKSKGLGIWKSKGVWPWRAKESDVESPMDFKRRQKEQEAGRS